MSRGRPVRIRGQEISLAAVEVPGRVMLNDRRVLLRKSVVPRRSCKLPVVSELVGEKIARQNLFAGRHTGDMQPCPMR